MEYEVSESGRQLPSHPAAPCKATFNGERKVPVPETSSWSAVEATDTGLPSHGARLQGLERRMVAAEEKWVVCERVVAEMGQELESKLSALGTLIRENSLLQRRLDNLENLLKNRNFWILRLPPGIKGEIPQVPVTFGDISVHFDAQEWANLDEGQKELYKGVMRSNYEMLVSLDYAISKPRILSQIERGEEPRVEDVGDSEAEELPVDPGSPIAATDASSWDGEEVKEEVRPFDDPEESQEMNLAIDPDLELQIVQDETGPQIKEEQEEIHIKEEPASPASPSSGPLVPAWIKQEEEEEEEEEEEQPIEDQQVLVPAAGRRTPCRAEEEEKSAAQPSATEDPERKAVEGNLFQCEMCAADGSPRTASADHPYSRKRKFQCTGCNRSFAFQGQLSQHLLTHAPGAQFPCAQCNLCFSSQKSLAVHERVHSADWALPCSVCSKAGPPAFDQNQQSPAPGRPAPCLECSVYFTDPAALAAHRRMHSDDWPFRCPQCDRTFVHQGLLLEHLENHSRMQSRRCHTCGSWLSYKGTLMPSGARLFHCKRCNTAGRVPGDLRA
ncbi:uncharacterized protein LOC114607590 [Podarcis muralis]